MNGKPHNANLINDVMKVLGGNTAPASTPVPQWVVDASYGAAVELHEAYTNPKKAMTTEVKRDIMRRHLSEAVSRCGCELGKDVATQFDKEVEKRLGEGVSMTTKPIPTQPKKTQMIAEAVESPDAGIRRDMKEFLSQLTEQEIGILRGVLAESKKAK